MSENLREINAVTVLTADMAQSYRFYADLGFVAHAGGPDAEFSTLRAGSSYMNLQLDESISTRRPIWGRAIFWVHDVDAMYELAVGTGHRPEMAPADAPWGERYFHIRDPFGHELSFAQPLED